MTFECVCGTTGQCTVCGEDIKHNKMTKLGTINGKDLYVDCLDETDLVKIKEIFVKVFEDVLKYA